MRTAKNFI